MNLSIDMVPDFILPQGLNKGLIATKGGAQSFKFPEPTTPEGDFSKFITLQNISSASGDSLLPGNSTKAIQALNYYVHNTTNGNATAYLVPPEGFTIVSDIDDILRVTRIWVPHSGLVNTFAVPYTPWLNMPSIYANWSKTVPDLHFHYASTVPEQLTQMYIDFIYKTYPLGSFDSRPLDFANLSAEANIRKVLLESIFRTYPKRKFILIADTSNADVMVDYPAMATEFPGQVQCILLRNTTVTDPSDPFPYNTSNFASLDSGIYMFFNVPDDLVGLDVFGGQCVNASVKQNIGAGTQGGTPDKKGEAAKGRGKLVWAALAGLLAAALGGL